MKKLILAVAFATAVFPVCVHAQSFDGASPQVQAQIDQARSDAQQNAMNALSDDHRTKVTAILTQVQNGSLSHDDGQKQIDALLTSDEANAVLAQGQKFHQAMQQALQGAGGSSGMGGFGGGSHRGGFGGGGRRTPDAGNVLLMLSGEQHSGAGAQRD